MSNPTRDPMPDWLPADEAIRTRRSCRAFLPTPVDRATVEQLLALASRSPSGSNIQPWKVRVVAGAARERVSRAVLESLDREGAAAFRREWNYYPEPWREPFLARRRKVGWDLYGLLGIPKGDFERSEAYRLRNYEFFGAPVGLVFTLDEDLEIGSWLDLGIFIGNLMTAARGFGLDTCPQAAFGRPHRIIRELLGIPEREMVVCGMALGYADPDGLINRLHTDRAAVDEFTTFHGFAPAGEKA